MVLSQMDFWPDLLQYDAKLRLFFVCVRQEAAIALLKLIYSDH